jgi:elongation factor P
MISTNEFKTGLAIRVDGTLYIIEEYQHVKPGKGGAFMRTKLRHLTQGSVIERTFRAGEKFEEAFIDERSLQFLYKSGTDYHFMDLETYEDRLVAEAAIGPSAGFVKESMELKGRFHEGALIGVELPIFVDLKIEYTEPGIRGDTSKAGNKPAKLETGVTVHVPLFIEAGETIRIDTRTGAYVSRA